jgi:hypothetical protein
MRKVTLDDGQVRFEVFGHLLTEEEFDAAFPKEDGEPGSSFCAWKRAIESDSLAVHPLQVPAAMARDKLHGLNVEYLPDGRPKLVDRGQRRKMLKSLGFHDNDGGFGDG